MDVANIIPQLLTAREAGRRVCLTPRKIKALALAGRIDHVRIDGQVYFTAEDVTAFINANRVRNQTEMEAASASP